MFVLFLGVMVRSFDGLDASDIARECFDAEFALHMHVTKSFVDVGMSLHSQCAVFYVDDKSYSEMQVRAVLLSVCSFVRSQNGVCDIVGSGVGDVILRTQFCPLWGNLAVHCHSFL